jgi:hypothetical protein
MRARILNAYGTSVQLSLCTSVVFRTPNLIAWAIASTRRTIPYSISAKSCTLSLIDPENNSNDPDNDSNITSVALAARSDAQGRERLLAQVCYAKARSSTLSHSVPFQCCRTNSFAKNSERSIKCQAHP